MYPNAGKLKIVQHLGSPRTSFVAAERRDWIDVLDSCGTCGVEDRVIQSPTEPPQTLPFLCVETLQNDVAVVELWVYMTSGKQQWIAHHDHPCVRCPVRDLREESAETCTDPGQHAFRPDLEHCRTLEVRLFVLACFAGS